MLSNTPPLPYYGGLDGNIVIFRYGYHYSHFSPKSTFVLSILKFFRASFKEFVCLQELYLHDG